MKPHPGKITGIDIAIVIALLLVMVALIIRIIWLARTDWQSLLSSMTPLDWLLAGVTAAAVIFLQRRIF